MIVPNGEYGIISDIHLGHPDISYSNLVNSAEQLVSQYESRDVDGVFVLGDVIHESNETTDRERLQTVADLVSPLPNVVIPGNHDCVYISYDEFADIFDNKLTTLVGETDETAVVSVDTSNGPIQNVGFIDEAVYDIVGDIEKNIVFLSHYPLGYSDVYQHSDFFQQYPEGVFPINKFEFELEVGEKRDQIHNHCGHLHIPYQDTTPVGDLTVHEPVADIANQTAQAIPTTITID